jgi:hypothetical protein
MAKLENILACERFLVYGKNHCNLGYIKESTKVYGILVIHWTKSGLRFSSVSLDKNAGLI